MLTFRWNKFTAIIILIKCDFNRIMLFDLLVLEVSFIGINLYLDIDNETARVYSWFSGFRTIR